MSRVGKKVILIPKNVQIDISNNLLNVEGPKGKLQYHLPERIQVELKDSQLVVKRLSDSKTDTSLHGTSMSIIYNMIKGVTEGFVKELEIVGVGFRAQVQGKKLNVLLGFSHPVEYNIPDGIVIEAPKPNQIFVKGIDKVKVGEVAAEIRSFYEPEPYKGKGIRYAGEYVRRKAGKTVA